MSEEVKSIIEQPFYPEDCTDIRAQKNSKRIEKIEEKIESIEELIPDVEAITEDVEDLKGRMESAEGDIEDIQGDIETIEGDVSDAKDDIQDLKDERTISYAANITIEDTDWTDGLQGQEYTYTNALIGANDVILVSPAAEEGRSNFETVRDLEIIATASTGSIKFVCNTHDAPDTVVLTVVVQKKIQSLE